MLEGRAGASVTLLPDPTSTTGGSRSSTPALHRHTSANASRRSERFVGDDDVFLANYADVLYRGGDLPSMIDEFYPRDRPIVQMMTVQPSNYTFHAVRMKDERHVAGLDDVLATPACGSTAATSSSVRRSSITSAPGEELVVEPFARLAAADRLIAYRYEGFWAPLDTLKDMLALEEAQDTGRPPWAPWLQGSA